MLQSARRRIKSKSKKIDSFNFKAGLEISSKFVIIKKLGAGWESEVYLVKESLTGIERAVKFFFPHRNKENKTARVYAQKLHKLRNCTIFIQYLTQGRIIFKNTPITYLVSEYVDGERLDEFLNRQKGKRLPCFQVLHLIHTLAKGLDEIHRMKEYHGDLHTENVIVQRYGLGFDLKILDMFHWGAANKENRQEDVCNLIRIFYDAIGGKKYYSSQPQEVKNIICGLKRTIILDKFKTAGHLKTHIENLAWD